MSSPKTEFSAQSYRDRDGFISIEEDVAIRYVMPSYADNYEQLMGSGLYANLVAKQLLIPHQEITLDHEPGIYKMIQPEFIPFISYPYEWTFDQWKEMALKTLQINGICLKHGMILKDASPFNFTWHKGQAVFLDTLSFEKYQSGSAWIAYRQFCETILGPLSLIAFCGAAWARSLQSFINGWDLPFISQSLPSKTWLNKSLFLHIHLHAKTRSQPISHRVKTKMNAEKLLALWKWMEKGIEQLEENANSNKWSFYYDETILSQAYLEEKTSFIHTWLKSIPSCKLIDLGANTGKFSCLASRYFDQVIAIESDIGCLKILQKNIQDKAIFNITTVWSDLTQPSAALGWNNEERTDLLSRLTSDCLLALALIHHLCIAKNIRLEMLASLFAKLTNQWAIVEFIPKDDPKIKSMLENRKDVFEDYSETKFLQAFDKYFYLRESISLKHSQRKLYLWEKK